MKILPLAVVFVLAATAGAAFADYPKIVKGKKLYAETDFRGKEAPHLDVQEWLTGSAPATDGKVVLLDFWATWCPPCRALIPELNGYKKKFGDDLVIIGVSDEPAQTVKEFMKNTPMEYNVAVDTNAKTKGVIGIMGIPHVMIISADGIVRWQGYPGLEKDKLTEEKVADIIAASKSK